MRRTVSLVGLLLAACSGGGDTQPEAAQERIWCALGGATAFAQNCVLERVNSGGTATFVVRHPDGAFHRLEVSKDGQNLLAADGADLSQSALKQDRYEVILSGARYVIPLHAQGK